MEIDKASKKDVFGASRMPSIEELLREKRLRWLGHLMREDDDEPAKQTLWREKENKSEWFRLVAADLASRRLSFEKAVLTTIIEPSPAPFVSTTRNC